MKTRAASVASIAWAVILCLNAASAQPRHATNRIESRSAREAREREENRGYTLNEWGDFWNRARAIVLSSAPLSPKDREFIKQTIPWSWLTGHYQKGKWEMSWRLPSGGIVSLEGSGDFFVLENAKVIGGTVSKEQIKRVEEFLEMVQKKRRSEEHKAAQPGATDNPDDAQRLREDH